MHIALNRPFASNMAVDGFDVRQMKKALNRLGYYQPLEKTGITDIADAKTIDALRRFQKAHGLLATGAAKPNDGTIRALNDSLAKAPGGYYIWRTVEDGKVRPAHAQFNHHIRSWKDSPDPGDDYHCRCWAKPVRDVVLDVEDLPLGKPYTELLLPPLAGFGRLYRVWKIWSEFKRTQWRLGNHKSPTRWGNQIKNRNWTPEEITETIKLGKRYPAPNKVNQGNKAILYKYKDRYVVRDEVTKEILQISRKNFKHPTLDGE